MSAPASLFGRGPKMRTTGASGPYNYSGGPDNNKPAQGQGEVLLLHYGKRVHIGFCASPLTSRRRVLLSVGVAALCLAEAVFAADENAFLERLQPPPEQTVGQGHTALWTMPLVATQYQPSHPDAAVQKAVQAQNDGRFLDALILLDEAGKNPQAEKTEVVLLRASFLLQGGQSRQALELLAPLFDGRYAASAHALAAMARLQQGQMREALGTAREAGDGVLPQMALSYALQGSGRLEDARETMRVFNERTPSAVTLAREAELALTLDHVGEAQSLIGRAQQMDAAHPYVVAVSGLAELIDGRAAEAQSAFETALKRDPNDAKALLGLGLAEIRLGDFADGQKSLEAANEADPGNALILTYLGRAQQQAGQFDAARTSWRSAQLADPKDPAPWLYQAQAELQANQLQEARESLRQAQARTAYRSVYRGERLLREDEQLLQANLAEIQRRLGLETLAFRTLADSVGQDSAMSLRDQADLLEGQRFGESARRSLLLQSLFDDRPGNLPAPLDIYGDGAGQTGASTPQHGVVSGLNAQQASYNNYDELFNRRTMLEADAVTGSRNSNGEQVRFGVGSDTLGLSVAQRQYKTDGYATFDNLDNKVGQAVAQWRPDRSTQAFASYQVFDSQRGETFYPADPFLGANGAVEDHSSVTRLGFRHTWADGGEVRGLWSVQQTGQGIDFEDFSVPPITFSQPGSSIAHSAELQYRRSGKDWATQWGVVQTKGETVYPTASFDRSLNGRQFYAVWRQMLNPYWRLEAELDWGEVDKSDNDNRGNDTSLKRWLPKLGLVYVPDDRTHLRFAAWQGMGAGNVGGATLAPVSLAGVLLTRPGDDGKQIKALALGGDRQLTSDWTLTADVQRRRTSDPVVAGQQALVLIEQEVNESKIGLHWQARSFLAVGLVDDYERIQNDPSFVALDSVNEQSFRSQQLSLHWFSGTQWMANLTWSHNQVDGTQQSHDPFFAAILVPYEDGFDQIDADLNWQFDRSRGMLTAGVRNAADARFQYMDIDRLNPRFSNGRLVYAKLKWAW